MIDRHIHFYNYECTQNKKGVAPSRCATPFKTLFFLFHGLFVLSVQSGAVQFSLCFLFPLLYSMMRAKIHPDASKDTAAQQHGKQPDERPKIGLLAGHKCA